MIKSLLTILLAGCMLAAGAQSLGNNGNHKGGGNNGNGKGNGGAVAPAPAPAPAYDPDQEEDPTPVPFDNGVYWLISGAVVYGLFAHNHFKKKQSPASC
jgi:hypothetical protein